VKSTAKLYPYGLFQEHVGQKHKNKPYQEQHVSLSRFVYVSRALVHCYHADYAESIDGHSNDAVTDKLLGKLWVENQKTSTIIYGW
jgi:hypothetical protein